jgi:hypothetical protein
MRSIWHIIQRLAQAIWSTQWRARTEGSHLQPRPIAVGIRVRNTNHAPRRPGG